MYDKNAPTGGEPIDVAARAAQIIRLWRDAYIGDRDAVRRLLPVIGFSADESQKILDNIGLSIGTGKKHRWTAGEKALLIDMYLSGRSWDDIVAELNLPLSVIRAMVGRLRLHRSPKGS